MKFRRTAIIGLSITMLSISFAVGGTYLAQAAKSLAALLAESSSGPGSAKDEVLKINDQIQERKQKISDITSRIGQYQEKIEVKRKESASLQNQLSIIENRIAKTELEIEEAEEEIESTNLEIRALDLQIEEKESLIKREKEQVAEGIRQIDRADQRNKLSILLVNDSFSEFWDEIAQLEGVYSSLGASIDRLQTLQGELKSRREDVDGKRGSLQKLKNKLSDIRESLVESQNGKETLLIESKVTAAKFQDMVGELRREQLLIDNDLGNLEGVLRDRLKGSDFAISPDQVILSWPVPPDRGITTYFHDLEYPFRYVFEHAGLDIRAYQGSPVRASAAGYVARVRNGGKGYSYIMLVHGGNISTVYGHLSVLSAAQDTFVERGAVIGYSGGAPGTAGAGYLTTGPHLHFEVRLNGVPVDPIKYLLR